MFKKMWVIKEPCEDFYEKHKDKIKKVHVGRLEAIFVLKSGESIRFYHTILNERNLYLFLTGGLLLWTALAGLNIF